MVQDNSRIEMFLMMNNKYFEPQHLMDIKNKLQNFDDRQWALIQTAQFKDPTVLIIISVLAGGFGIDRFMLGEVGLGIAKLLTCGGLGIWHIIDMFLIMGATKEKNYEIFNELILTGLPQ